MQRIALFVGSLGLLAFSSLPSAAQTLSQKICSAAQAYLAAQKTPIPEGTLLASAGVSPRADWTQLSWMNTRIGDQPRVLYLAYFFNMPSLFSQNSEAGAVSIKVSLFKEQPASATPSVELYRSPIARGTNRCEPRGRREILDRRVRINEYIDYHSRTGTSPSLEAFHFRYPRGTNECAYTDRPEGVAKAFLFPELGKTSSDTLLGRILGDFIGQAQASDHKFARLRSELHYYRQKDAPACVGFHVPLNGSNKKASILIHDLSSSWFSAPGSWLIQYE